MKSLRWLPALFVVGIGLSPIAAQPPLIPNNNEVFLRVKVPTDDTKLEVQGVLTQQKGLLRIFKSPSLVPGKKYFYDAKATWVVDGKTLTRSKSVVVTAGGTFDLDMTVDDNPVDSKPKNGKPMDPADVQPVDPKPVEVKPKPMQMPPPKPKEPKPVEPKPIDTKPKDPKPSDTKPKDPPRPVEPPKPLPASKLDAPNVASPEVVVQKMLELAKVKEGDVVYDLGCGDGRIVIAAVKNFKASKAVGIDIDPYQVFVAQEKVKKENLTDKITIRLADIMKLTEMDLSEATVVTLYLLPKTNEALKPMLAKLKKGTRIVSHDYDIFGWEEDSRAELKVDGLDHAVYLYTVK